MPYASAHTLGVQGALAQTQLDRDVCTRDHGLLWLKLYIGHRDVHVVFYVKDRVRLVRVIIGRL